MVGGLKLGTRVDLIFLVLTLEVYGYHDAHEKL
jgi:hypothetical protein